MLALEGLKVYRNSSIMEEIVLAGHESSEFDKASNAYT